MDAGDFVRAARFANALNRAMPSYGAGWFVSFLLAVSVGEKVVEAIEKHAMLSDDLGCSLF